MKVYLDLYALVNLLMNSLIFTLTAKLHKNKPSLLQRLLLSSVATIFAILILVLRLGPFQFLIGIAFYIIIGLLLKQIYQLQTIGQCIREVLVYFVASAVIAGGIMCLKSRIKISLIPLLLASILVEKLLSYVMDSIFYCKKDERNQFQIILERKGKRINGTGFYDTGNQLREPISGTPVSVVEFGFVKELLSQMECQTIENFPDGEMMEGIRVIPYRSVGKKQGILPAILISRFAIKYENEWIYHENVWMAVCNQQLFGRSNCQIIMNQEIL